MSDDFGTINVKPRTGERAREIEVMRQHYRRHRDALTGMADDAPTEHLANEYRRLIHEIDLSFAKLEELEGRAVAPPPAPKAASDAHAGSRPQAGQRPLVASPAAGAHRIDDESGSPASRLVLIIVAALVVLALIGWLIWRASSDERPITPIVEDGETDTVAAAEPPPPPAPLGITPEGHDYGVIRKGTRAARQFEIVNTTDSPISIKVARSACRCLYYDYADVVPPNGRETLTVTVDGAKAPAGQLQESIAVTSAKDQTVAASFGVTATVR